MATQSTPEQKGVSIFKRKPNKSLIEMKTAELRREEVTLALRVADIIDELNILKRLFQTQKDVLSAAGDDINRQIEEKNRELGRKYPQEPGSPVKVFGNFNKLDRLAKVLKYLSKSEADKNLSQVIRMLEEVERVQKSLFDLLDLQQKEDNLHEAQTSNKQAQLAQEQSVETSAQSNIIMLFTLVTIVFLPLSFFTSYYGMVAGLAGSSSNPTLGQVWKTMGAASGTIIIVLLTLAWWVYQHGRTQGKQEIDKWWKQRQSASLDEKSSSTQAESKTKPPSRSGSRAKAHVEANDASQFV
jgi:hypothetical protein